MADPINITITDDLVTSSKSGTYFDLHIGNLAPTADVTEANDITFSDGTDLSAHEIRIHGFGKGDGQADTFTFDLSNFNDDFDVSIHSEGPEDSFIINRVDSYVENSGVYTIDYYGSDGNLHTMTLDPGNADVILNAVCLTPGVRVATPEGLRPAGDLRVGDLVLTRDRGAQPLRWIGRRRIVFGDGTHRFKPILVAKGAIDGRVPQRDVLISPQHRILLWGCAVLGTCGRSEALASAKALTDQPGIRQAQGKTSIEYITLMFDHHEIIDAEGMLTESFLPRPYAREYLSAPEIDALTALVPDALSDAAEAAYPAARPLLKVQQARKLAGAALDEMRADATRRKSA